MRQLVVLFALVGIINGSPFTYSNETGILTDGTGFTPETRQARGSCSYGHTFSNINEFIYLNSENYPGNYSNNLDCTYTINSPRMTQITLECDDFNVEASTNCQYDRLFWSLSGDPYFRDLTYVCGQGRVNKVTSSSNRLTIGFKSDATNPQSNVPWRYECRLTTVPAPCSERCGIGGGVMNKIQNETGFFLTTRIVGGTEATPAELPWNVLLYAQSLGTFCGGTLISHNWVVTAAHCTANVDSGETIYADIGDHDITTTSDGNNRVIAVDRIIQNSLYNSKNQDNDISLLHLSTPVNYDRNIQPICLPWKFTSMNFDSIVATASGWGTTSFGGSVSTVLRKVQLDCKSAPTCRQIYSDRDVTITENQFCAYRPGQDTCQGDSGGPLQYNDRTTGLWSLIGVISNGPACAEPNSPGIYVTVAKYLGWIEQNTGEYFCKA